jgi:hypothetical protein
MENLKRYLIKEVDGVIDISEVLCKGIDHIKKIEKGGCLVVERLPKYNRLTQRLSIKQGELKVVALSPTEYKRKQKEAEVEIDNEVADRMSEGFSFDGQRFSLSIPAQTNWVRLVNQYKIGIFPESKEISSKSGSYMLLKKNVLPFFQAFEDQLESILSDNRKRKAELV